VIRDKAESRTAATEMFCNCAPKPTTTYEMGPRALDFEGQLLLQINIHLKLEEEK